MVAERKAALTQKEKIVELLAREPSNNILLQRAGSVQASIDSAIAAASAAASAAGGGGSISGGGGGGGLYEMKSSPKDTKNDNAPSSHPTITTTSTSSSPNNAVDGQQPPSKKGSLFDFLTAIPRSIPPLRSSLPSHPTTPMASPSTLPRLMHSMSGSSASMPHSTKSTTPSPHLHRRSSRSTISGVPPTSSIVLPGLQEHSSSKEYSSSGLGGIGQEIESESASVNVSETGRRQGQKSGHDFGTSLRPTGDGSRDVHEMITSPSTDTHTPIATPPLDVTAATATTTGAGNISNGLSAMATPPPSVPPEKPLQNTPDSKVCVMS